MLSALGLLRIWADVFDRRVQVWWGCRVCTLGFVPCGQIQTSSTCTSPRPPSPDTETPARTRPRLPSFQHHRAHLSQHQPFLLPDVQLLHQNIHQIPPTTTLHSTRYCQAEPPANRSTNPSQPTFTVPSNIHRQHTHID